MLALLDKIRAIREFLDWLESGKDGRVTSIFLAFYHEHDGDCRDGELRCSLGSASPERYKFQAETLLAEFYNIDLVKVEKERRAIVEAAHRLEDH